MELEHDSVELLTTLSVASSDNSGALAFEPIQISHIVIDEIGVPKGDGTKGSALYVVPFRLSRRPPQAWCQYFVESWDHPERFSCMHRPGIASIRGDTVVLDGTTIEEVGLYHRETLVRAVNAANSKFTELEKSRAISEHAERERVEKHRMSVTAAAKGLRFDDSLS
jgi:hypothetical protein